MPQLALTDELRGEYRGLFNSIENKFPMRSQTFANNLAGYKSRYKVIEEATGVPWFVVGLIHMRESTFSFASHLHNGDSLQKRTHNYPANRPTRGRPPFQWEESAIDAIRFKKLDKWEDWSVSGIAYILEDYNGWGYRPTKPEVKSPYLWNWSQHYDRGKYVADHVFSHTKVDAQPGTMVILHYLIQLGKVKLDQDVDPVFIYDGSQKRDDVKGLQAFLNTVPGVKLVVDGYPGPATSDAVRFAFGHRLKGDPRNEE